MKYREFEDLVANTLASLPQEFQTKLGDVAIFIEEWPERELLVDLEMDPDEETLFGLFEPGEPIPDASRDFPDSMPARITIYKGPIEEVCDTDDAIAEEVRLTVLHEVGHYFGLSEEQVEHL